jgi:hypothetical protein
MVKYRFDCVRCGHGEEIGARDLEEAGDIIAGKMHEIFYRMGIERPERGVTVLVFRGVCVSCRSAEMRLANGYFGGQN